MADEAPGFASETSPTSLWLISPMSSPIFAGDAGSDRKRRAELGDSRPVRVPGRDRLGQLELAREQPEHLGTAVTERRRCPGGTAQLDGEPLVADSDERCSRLEHGDEPACRFEAERDRLRLLQQRPPDHRRDAMGVRELRALLGNGPEALQDQPQHPARDEHRRRVQDVLARRAEVDVLGRAVVPDRLSQGTDERLDRVARRATLLGERRRVERLGPAGGDDRFPGLLGDDPRGHLRTRERRLHLAAGPRATRSPRARRGRRRERRDRRTSQTAKKTVCPSPWSRTSSS